MCLAMVCGAAEDVLGSQKAPGDCPYCGGAVVVADVERTYRLLFLPLCRKIHRRFSCSRCSRRLVVALAYT